MLLQVKKLSKSYGHRQVLDSIDFGIEKGERVAIMGPSGCGKTTLLNCLGAVDRPDEGQIIFNDTMLTGMSGEALNQFRRDQLGFIFQFFHLLPTLTVEENIGFPMMLAKATKAEQKERVDHLINEVGLSEVRSSLPGTLSGGEMQRVAIARALVMSPPLLLADEPTGNLDESTGQRILQLLQDICSETQTALVMVTHSNDAAAICNRIIHLRSGRLSHETTTARKVS
jgi:ABC-type lipoprotein export system ATPase subunit